MVTKDSGRRKVCEMQEEECGRSLADEVQTHVPEWPSLSQVTVGPHHAWIISRKCFFNQHLGIYLLFTILALNRFSLPLTTIPLWTKKPRWGNMLSAVTYIFKLPVLSTCNYLSLCPTQERILGMKKQMVL